MQIFAMAKSDPFTYSLKSGKHIIFNSYFLF